MANISSITLPNGNNYGFTGTVYNVIGTQTAATGSWTGALHGVPALYTGLTIMYYLPWAGSGNATLNLTLDDGTTTGAVNCYYSNSRLTTHYGKGCNIIMTYYKAGDIKIDGTATTDNRWIANANYADGNSVAYRVTTYYNRFKAGANKIFPYTIIMQCPDGRWESIVTSSSTGTSKARNTHAFILGQIAVMYANATYNENATVGDNVVWDHATDLIDHRYSFNTANNSTSGTTAVKPIYLVGSINPLDGYFYLDTTWWTQTLPTTNDGKLYIYLGDAYDYYRMSFRMNHPIYCHTNGMIREYAQDCATINGLTVEKSVPSNAVFTDTKVTQTGTNTDANYEVLFSASASNNEETAIVRKCSGILCNPSIGELKPSKLTASTSVNGQSGYFTDELCTRWIAVKDGNNNSIGLFEADGTDLIIDDVLVLGIQNSVFKKVWSNSDPHTSHDYSTDSTIIINADDLYNYTKVRIDFFPVYAVYNMTSQYFDLPDGSTYPIQQTPVAFGTYLTMCYRNITLKRTSATQLEITWGESGKFATYGSSSRTAGAAFMTPATIYLTN